MRNGRVATHPLGAPFIRLRMSGNVHRPASTAIFSQLVILSEAARPGEPCSRRTPRDHAPPQPPAPFSRTSPSQPLDGQASSWVPHSCACAWVGCATSILAGRPPTSNRSARGHGFSRAINQPPRSGYHSYICSEPPAIAVKPPNLLKTPQPEQVQAHSRIN